MPTSSTGVITRNLRRSEDWLRPLPVFPMSSRCSDEFAARQVSTSTRRMAMAFVQGLAWIVYTTALNLGLAILN